MNLFDKAPTVHREAFVAPSASIIGDVQVGRNSSIWYGCVLRGDVNSISIGAGTNIQDNSLVHVAKSNLAGKVLSTVIGNNVTVGHSAVLHGCTVEDEAFVGMGATLLDGVVVEKKCHGCCCIIAFLKALVASFTNISVHATENAKSFDEIEFEKVLRKKFARKDEDYDSMLGVVRETPQELILPDNILPDKAPKAT
nr:gamma carbonic anhydrase 1, mitochondrial-like [Ipomoea batatas]